MASKIDIIKQALSQCGVDPLVAADTTTASGRAALSAYDMVLDILLEFHAWGFATYRVDLQQLTETPTYGFDYAYAVPSNCLRVLEVYPDTEYALEASGTTGTNLQILSNEDELSLKYVARVTETGRMPPWFVVAFADALAARLCFPLEGSATKMGVLEKRANTSVALAISRDCRQAWQDPGPDDSTDSWIYARGKTAVDDTTVIN